MTTRPGWCHCVESSDTTLLTAEQVFCDAAKNRPTREGLSEFALEMIRDLVEEDGFPQGPSVNAVAAAVSDASWRLCPECNARYDDLAGPLG